MLKLVRKTRSILIECIIAKPVDSSSYLICKPYYGSTLLVLYHQEQLLYYFYYCSTKRSDCNNSAQDLKRDTLKFPEKEGKALPARMYQIYRRPDPVDIYFIFVALSGSHLDDPILFFADAHMHAWL